MLSTETLNLVFKLFPQEDRPPLPMRRVQRTARAQQMTLTHEAAQGMGFQGNREPVPMEESQGEQRPGDSSRRAPAKQQPIQVGDKVGRNDPCPCGSGKKYKQCHGR